MPHTELLNVGLIDLGATSGILHDAGRSEMLIAWVIAFFLFFFF